MIKALTVQYRRILIVGFHFVLIAFANILAFWIRFDGKVPDQELALRTEMIPWLILIRGIIFIPFQLYRGLWKYTGIWDLRNVIAGVTVSSVVFHIVVHWIFGHDNYPRSVVIIDSLLLIFLMGGSRMAWRLYHGLGQVSHGRRVLLYGAGDAGEMVIRDIKNHGALYHYEPVGFIDDNPGKIGRHIHGVQVLGSRGDLPRILQTHEIDEILLAIPSAAPALVRQMLTILAPFKIPIKTLPTLSKLQNGTVGASHIQDLSVEDLLDRVPIGLDLSSVRDLVRGKRVLITGAGGSIGSELSRQIAGYEPARLMMLDNSESALYDIDMELQRKFSRPERSAVLVDIRNARSLERVFRDQAPEIVFHAAAYKHVPMMEHYPGQAVLNNVIGTERLVQAAIRHKTRRFVLISTDKAVNPSNIMGATKRLCEMYVQALARDPSRGETIFSAVRFGNVLGSNGSVIPLFLRQIEHGGPVTVTHPEVTRYFMTISEAVQLVLHAAALAEGGEIFVLEMGEQIKLLEMARHLIRLSGRVPDDEIAIQFVGLRPGEKLREELVAMDETLLASEVEKIRRVQSGWVPELGSLIRKIAELEQLAIHDKSASVIELLYELVPTFRSLNTNVAGQVRQRRVQKEGSLIWQPVGHHAA